MKKIYINGIGVNGGIYNSLSELRKILNGKEPPSAYRKVSLINRDIIQREDRAVLNSITLMAVNALHDLLSQNSYDGKSDWDIFTACDYTFDDHLLCDCIAYIKDKGKDNFWHSLALFSEFINPLELLRGLPTNTLYHISKILNNNGKGLPVDAGNLSELTSLSFIKDSHPTLIVSAGGQTGTKDKIIQRKNNLENSITRNMTWAGCALLTGDYTSHSIGSIQNIILNNHSFKEFRKYFNKYSSAFHDVNYFIHFGDELYNFDDDMITTHSLKVINYDFTGYSGRPDMLTKLACFMNDDNVPDKSMAYLFGCDSQYGFGCAVIQKGV
ncbi:hypothetical protein [Morganella morganii]|uniref:hypothetical protein n=1 Tax=Morganella morganii TaxID=582 RepID=UPI002368BB6E|nr:hypothetical protein [Morganella morganii]